MAELIRKDKLIDWTYREPQYYDSMNDRTDMRDFINELPSVTEADIRALAISDFIKALEEHTQKNWIDYHDYGITFADLELVAEQLKERE